MGDKISSSIIAAVCELHQEVDEKAARLIGIHKNRLQRRRGCHDCCVDNLTVFDVEAERIRQQSKHVLEMQPHPIGRCAFLNEEGACRIYENRPYVCRTQGLPLRWLEDVEDAAYEYRDICPLNEAGEPLEELDEDHCWTLGDFEGRLATLQVKSGGAKLQRIALRDLFQKDGRP